MKRTIIRGAILLSCCGGSFAQSDCILLKLVPEVEQVTSGTQGRKGLVRKGLAPADRVEPGGKVIYTVSAANICDRPVEPAVIDVPMPEHMTYVAGSAVGPGAEVSFSVDGGFHYAKPEALRMPAPDGVGRKAAPKDYTHIRWAMRGALGPGAVAFARFRAVFE